MFAVGAITTATTIFTIVISIIPITEAFGTSPNACSPSVLRNYSPGISIF